MTLKDEPADYTAEEWRWKQEEKLRYGSASSSIQKAPNLTEINTPIEPTELEKQLIIALGTMYIQEGQDKVNVDMIVKTVMPIFTARENRAVQAEPKDVTGTYYDSGEGR